MSKEKIIVLLLIISKAIFSSAAPDDTLNQQYKTVNYKLINIAEQIKKHKATVFLFYSPECPICKSQTKTVNSLYAQYGKDSIHFIVVFPQKYYTEKFIKRFLKDYAISITAIRDDNAALTNYMKATVTPEAVVLDRNRNRIYSGMIDNLFEDIGERRTIVTEHYLRDAIVAVLENKYPVIKRTEPVGCILSVN
ncbi:MAG: redoxin family protein [Bacteroidia bacterium]